MVRIITTLHHQRDFLFLSAEKDCCDGSDERPGFCPNVCKEIGDIYREQRKKEQKIQKTVITFVISIVFRLIVGK